MLTHVGREGDAGGLEDPADLTGNHGTGSDALAVLFDGGLLEAVEIAQQSFRPGATSRTPPENG